MQAMGVIEILYSESDLNGFQPATEIWLVGT